MEYSTGGNLRMVTIIRVLTLRLGLINAIFVKSREGPSIVWCGGYRFCVQEIIYFCSLN